MSMRQRLKQFGFSKLARELGITPSAVMQWGDKVPPERTRAVEQITGIPREEQRPDIFGPGTSHESPVGNEASP